MRTKSSTSLKSTLPSSIQSMQKKLGIFIPSRGRCSIIWQGTLSQLPSSLLPITAVVVGEEEAPRYSSILKPYNVTVVSTSQQGIPKVRQWIMEHADVEYVMYLSDDLIFSYRGSDGKLHPCLKENVLGMVEEMYRWLEEGYAHVGVSQRAFNHLSTADAVEVTRMNDVYAYNREIVLDSSIKFDDVFGMEDFHMTLGLLHYGYPNKVSYKYCWGQRKSGEAGGCSLYRTWETQRTDAFRLCKLHPGCVRIVAKESKTHWEGIGHSRVDVDIMWKKSYRPRRKGKPSFFWGT